MTITVSREDVTFGIAAVGAGLGIFNTWRTVRRDRVRLRVVPKLSVQLPGSLFSSTRYTPRLEALIAVGQMRLCIEVTNLSTFPVTISNVGFGWPGDKTFQAVFEPETSPTKPFPTRLEAREGVKFLAHPSARFDFEMRKEWKAYAQTDCGSICYATSPAFKEYVRRSRGNSALTTAQNASVRSD